jgi:outer membrane receptor protein involved in Fe transport
MNKSQLMLSTLLSGAVIGLSATPAFAQADDEEVIVTGSRVQRADLGAPSPVTTISAERLSVVNTVNTEEFINTLAQVIPATTGFSNNPGNGTATVNLRGLGSNRTLVLVDGNRYVSANGDGIVDLNSIPSALVKRVDVVTGGASAVYGSDAMAGVVNFILEDSFEGVELNSSYEITEKGDGAKKDISLTVGGNFDNGRGNATAYMAYSQRDALFQGERDFSAIANDDNGTGFDPFGSSGVPGSRIFDTFDFTNASGADPANCPEGTSVNTAGTSCTGGATFSPDGNIIPWINSGQNTTRYNYAPVNYLQLPQERYTAAAFGRYDITDTIELKVKSIFTSNQVPQELAPTPFFRTVTVDIDTNPFLTPSTVAAFTEANGGGGLYPFYLGRRMLEIGPRTNDQELQSLQLSADLSGEFGFGWDWDVHSHLSRTSGSVIQTGNVSISAFQAGVLSGQCNVFGQGNFSDECVDLVSRTGAIQFVSEQRNIVATTAGEFAAFKSPMADTPLQAVFGVEYKEDQFNFRPDSVLGPDVSGFNQSLPVDGVTESYEAFGEVYWPLIEGQEFAEEFSLNGAYRYTDHSLSGGFSSYAGGAEWAPTGDIRFRGQYQRAVRAPNVVELFSPQTNGFPGAVDPCAAQDGVAALGQQALCLANGVPAALYNTEYQANSQIEGLFGGNPDLVPETSDTITFGAVITPAAIPGLTMTVDYYDIDVDGAISTIPVQNVLTDCFNGSVPEYCGLINRSAAGLIDNIVLTNQNVAFLGAKGIDFQADYSFDATKVGLGGGEFAVQLQGGYQIANEFQPLPGDPIDDCVGFFQANAGICGEPIPKLKTTVTSTYSNGPWSTTVRWRHLSNTQVDDLHPNSGGGFAALFAPETGAFDYFDLTGKWDISDIFQLSGGVLNALDKQPPELGDCCSEQANTFPGSYDVLGRRFFLAGKVRF